MSYFDIWRQARDSMRHNNLVIFGNSGGHIPPQSVAESTSPIVPVPRWTKEQAYQWAKETIAQAYKDGRLK